MISVKIVSHFSKKVNLLLIFNTTISCFCDIIKHHSKWVRKGGQYGKIAADQVAQAPIVANKSNQKTDRGENDPFFVNW